jgi:hypothetical protein
MESVTAAGQEFDMAVSIHELWKPATHDAALHARMGRSYASQGLFRSPAVHRPGSKFANSSRSLCKVSLSLSDWLVPLRAARVNAWV